MIFDVLLATVPWRRSFCARLLDDLQKQTVKPRFVHLVLDGYGDDPLPRDLSLPIRIIEYRTAKPSGPGGRWRVLREPVLKDADVLVVLDDDQHLLDPDIIEKMVGMVEGGGAVAYRGMDERGFSGSFQKGKDLVCMVASAMALHTVDLTGLDETYTEIREKCKFDPFGDAGDDEAVISMHLWRRGVRMSAVGFLGIETCFGTRERSQTTRRLATKGGRSIFWQREEIRRATGWPWPVANA